MVEPGVEEHVWQHHVTGEEPLWETKEWDVKVDARTSRYIATPYESVLTITMPMKEVAK